MTTPIVFAELTDGAATSNGPQVQTLPTLRVFGSQTSVEYGVLDLPRLRVTSAGTATTSDLNGTGLVVLPATFAFGTDVAALAVTYPGYSLLLLPSLRTSGVQAASSMDTPGSGNGLLNLPRLQLVTASSENVNAGAVVMSLQPLQVFGFEAAGAWAAPSLPKLKSAGVQTVVAPTAFSNLQQSPGYLSFSASGQSLFLIDTDAVGDVSTALQDILVIQAALAASFAADSRLRARPDIALNGVLSDAMALAYNMLVDFAAQGAVSVDQVKLHSLAVADVLTATLAVETPMRALYTVALAGAMADAIAMGIPLDATFAGTLADEVQARLAILMSVDNAGSGDVTTTNILRMSLVVADGGVAALDPVNAVRALFDTSLNGLLYLTLRFGAADYSGWVMNTENAAPSAYQNYPFDGFATYNGKHYGFGPAGTVQFGGATDAGAAIPAWLRTFFMDFGTGTEKRVADVYIGATNAGRLVVKAVSYHRGTGKKYEDWYAVKTLPGTGVVEGRAEIGKGLRSTWWQFELHNAAGSDFELEEITFNPILSDRRV